MALLDVRNVSKNFGAIRALTDVSFTVEPGEVVGLMGDNGAGKSTIVKLVAGNFPPNDGEVAVAGEVCQRPFEMGYKTMMALWAMKEGKAAPADPTYTGLDVCTPETADTCIAK